MYCSQFDRHCSMMFKVPIISKLIGWKLLTSIFKSDDQVNYKAMFAIHLPIMSANGDDDIEAHKPFAISEDLMASRIHKVAGTTTLDFDGLLHPPLKLHEDLAGGCGGQLWPAGIVLAKYLLRRPQRDTLQGKVMFVWIRILWAADIHSDILTIDVNWAQAADLSGSPLL